MDLSVTVLDAGVRLSGVWAIAFRQKASKIKKNKKTGVLLAIEFSAAIIIGLRPLHGCA